MNTVPLNSLNHFLILALGATLIACGSDGDSPGGGGVPLARPALANITSTQTYTVGTAIAPLAFTNSGGGSLTANTGCMVSPALPAGLTVEVSSNNTTCQISGTPTAAAEEATYTVTATNAANSDDATVTITVNAALTAPVLANIDEAQTYTVGTTIAPVAFSNSGGGSLTANTGCTVSPTLPAGLTVEVSSDATTCQISGTPTAETEETAYTVTATNATDSDTATVTITVNAAAPVLANIDTAQTYAVGTEITPLSFGNSGGGSLTACTVAEPALPAGLSAAASSDGSTCQISGTPTATAEEATYTVTATNSGGMNTATVVIAVNLLAPSLANAAAQRFDAGTSITPVKFDNTGGGLLTGCTAGDEFPAGLSLDISSDGSTCEINGIPAGPAVGTPATHTITATNPTGSNTATVAIAITVDNTLPLLQPVDDPLRFPVEESLQIEIENAGAGGLTTPGGCTIEPTIPAGLTLDFDSSVDGSCNITGTPAEGSELTGYTITATNSSGSTKVKIYLAIDSEFIISDENGLVGDNTVVIVTEMATPAVSNTSVLGDAEGASPKMRYTVDDDNGEITVTVTEHASQGLFTTLFENDPESTQTMDFRSYEENGLLLFEVMSEDWGTYGESGTTDGFAYKVDHSIPNGEDSCDCEMDLDVSGDMATGEWITVRQPISDWVDSARTGNELLNLQYVKTGIVLFPNLESQNSNNGAGGDVEFKLRNIRWVIRKLPDLVGFSDGPGEAGQLRVTATNVNIVMTNNGGGFLTACTASSLPPGFRVDVSDDSKTCVISGTQTFPVTGLLAMITATNDAGSDTVNTTFTTIGQ